MNLEQLKKNVNQRVRVRPWACRFLPDGTQLPPADDDWTIIQVTNAGAIIQNQATQHQTTLGADHIHHYTSDPDRSVKGQSSGILTLNVQIVLLGPRLLIEPIQRPGIADDAIRLPPPSRAEVLHQQLEVEARRRSFWTSDDFNQRLNADFSEFIAYLESAIPQLRGMRPDLGASLKRDGPVIMLSALGYGLTIVWHQSMTALQDARLVVTVWDRPLDSPYYVAGQAAKLREDAFAYDLAPTGAAMWFSDTAQHQAHTSQDLAAIYLRDILQRPGRDRLHWLSR